MTPLLKRILQEHRRVVLPLAIALLVNIVAYALVVYPRGVKAAGAADRAKVAESSLQAAQRENAIARGLVTGKARADEELASFYKKVLPANHDDAVRMTYASLPALARKTGVTYFRRSNEIEKSKPKQGETLEHLTISMALEGSYEDFREFIYQLESAPEFLIVDDVTLTERGPNEPLVFSVTMSTYFQKQANGI